MRKGERESERRREEKKLFKKIPDIIAFPTMFGYNYVVNNVRSKKKEGKEKKRKKAMSGSNPSSVKDQSSTLT